MTEKPDRSRRRKEGDRARAGEYQKALRILRERHREEFDWIYKLVREGKY